MSARTSGMEGANPMELLTGAGKSPHCPLLCEHRGVLVIHVSHPAMPCAKGQKGRKFELFVKINKLLPGDWIWRPGIPVQPCISRLNYHPPGVPMGSPHRCFQSITGLREERMTARGRPSFHAHLCAKVQMCSRHQGPVQLAIGRVAGNSFPPLPVFRMDIRKHFLSERVVMQWHSCPGRWCSHHTWKCSRSV